MNETFKAGEEVTLTTQDSRVRVEFGPFTNLVGHRPDAYLVKLLEGPDAGASITALSNVLKRRPRFDEDDAVVTLPLDTPGTIAAGPFKGRNGRTHYVVKADVSGNHVWLDEAAIRPASPVTRSRTFTLAGVRWDLDATYIDSDGDRWEFSGEFLNGVPLLDSDDAGRDYSGLKLTHVVNRFGPLTKRV